MAILLTRAADQTGYEPDNPRSSGRCGGVHVGKPDRNNPQNDLEVTEPNQRKDNQATSPCKRVPTRAWSPCANDGNALSSFRNKPNGAVVREKRVKKPPTKQQDSLNWADNLLWRKSKGMNERKLLKRVQGPEPPKRT